MRDVSSRQRPLRDLVLAQEYDALLVLRIPNEVLKKLHTSGSTRDPIMRADRHHPSTIGGFRVEQIEIVLQVLQVGQVRRGRRIKAYHPPMTGIDTVRERVDENSVFKER